ncbi:hypothetical protein PoB_004510300 [Plakobranchus ocellatus]|uniref:Uncharacterized protein n=1 Tax=Plakobranchus ocellatus TaxID=259542 RepID=A0AAV4BIG5_9GAST|nr:hypothetical protein PoB_004510300 [Plakobranchus ocellatus]
MKLLGFYSVSKPIEVLDGNRFRLLYFIKDGETSHNAVKRRMMGCMVEFNIEWLCMFGFKIKCMIELQTEEEEEGEEEVEEEEEEEVEEEEEEEEEEESGSRSSKVQLSLMKMFFF